MAPAALAPAPSVLEEPAALAPAPSPQLAGMLGGAAAIREGLDSDQTSHPGLCSILHI